MLQYISWYPQISNDTTIYGLTESANNISGGILMPLMLLTIGIIALLGTVFSGKNFFRGLLYAGFICSILSITLVLMSMLNINYMYLCFFLTAVGLVGVRFTEAPS